MVPSIAMRGRPCSAIRSTRHQGGLDLVRRQRRRLTVASSPRIRRSLAQADDGIGRALAIEQSWRTEIRGGSDDARGHLHVDGFDKALQPADDLPGIRCHGVAPGRSRSSLSALAAAATSRPQAAWPRRRRRSARHGRNGAAGGQILPASPQCVPAPWSAAPGHRRPGLEVLEAAARRRPHAVQALGEGKGRGQHGVHRSGSSPGVAISAHIARRPPALIRLASSAVIVRVGNTASALSSSSSSRCRSRGRSGSRDSLALAAPVGGTGRARIQAERRGAQGRR